MDERSSDERPPSRERATGSWLRYSHLGLQFCLTFLLPTLGGVWLDARLSWEPWLTVVGAMLGMTAATYVLVKETQDIGSR